MLGLGPTELMFIALIAFLVFGPSKLPEAIKTISQLINEFKKSTSDIKKEFKKEFIDLKDLPENISKMVEEDKD